MQVLSCFLLTLKRPCVVSHLFIGDRLETETNKVKLYQIDLEEINWLQQSGECTNYGGGEAFKTYGECVAASQHQSLGPLLNCVVPWMAGPELTGNLCKGKIYLSKKNFTTVRKMFEYVLSGQRYKVFDYSNKCPKPCKELHVTATMTGKVGSSPGYQGICLFFKSNAKVTEEMMAYGLVDLAVEVGSSLGLWVGLSALGIFDLFMDIAAKFHNLC